MDFTNQSRLSKLLLTISNGSIPEAEIARTALRDEYGVILKDISVNEMVLQDLLKIDIRNVLNEKTRRDPNRWDRLDRRDHPKRWDRWSIRRNR